MLPNCESCGKHIGPMPMFAHGVVPIGGMPECMVAALGGPWLLGIGRPVASMSALTPDVAGASMAAMVACPAASRSPSLSLADALALRDVGRCGGDEGRRSRFLFCLARARSRSRLRLRPNFWYALGLQWSLLCMLRCLLLEWRLWLRLRLALREPWLEPLRSLLFLLPRRLLWLRHGGRPRETDAPYERRRDERLGERGQGPRRPRGVDALCGRRRGGGTGDWGE